MNVFDSIKSFSKQFEYRPEIVNGERLGRFERFIFVGMGGSALGPDLLRAAKPNLDIIVHRDYGLPDLSDKVLTNSLIVINSYSGNTEEAVDAFNLAVGKNLSVAAISIGGKLLELAQKNGMPYIQMPDWGLQPRMALGLSIKALLQIIGEEDELMEIGGLSKQDWSGLENMGKELAGKLKNFIPVIYSSRQNGSVAYGWKIIINETAKHPAFSNVFPELTHNEMAGFASGQNFSFIFLKDPADNPKILKRMEISEKLFHDRNLPFQVLELQGGSAFHKIFSSLITAHWTAYYLAQESGVSPDDVSMIEEFKKLI